jgi:transposase
MKRQKTPHAPSPTSTPLHDAQPDAAGIDIGATEIWVAVPADRSPEPIRRFGTFTQDLEALVQHLQRCGIRSVAMESTGVYWIPLYQLLADAGLNVCLVNARHVKNVPGRKTDVQDCQWLQYLHSVGLLRASYRPAQAVCAVRSLYRYRQNLLAQAAQDIQHLQGALDQMNLKLHYVLDDLTGLSGQAILEAILSGERDAHALAKRRHFRVKASEEVLVKALQGDWRPEHLFVLRLAWENWQHLQHQIQRCDAQLLDYTRRLEAATAVRPPAKGLPWPDASGAGLVAPATPLLKAARQKTSKNQPEGPWREELQRVFGVDLTAIPSISVLTGITLMTELGADLSAFKTSHHFASWLCLCPDNATSASKVLRRQTRRSQQRVRQALRMAAASLHHDKSYLGDKYRRLRARLGAPKALTAMAHQLARIIWHLLTYRVPFDLSLFAAQEQANQRRQLKRLMAAARHLGYQLTPVAS